MSELDFLKQLREQTNCSYLLDLNNLWTNEKNLGISSKDFLSAIDENIAFVTTKIEHTKSYKKGLLQQMFV